MITAASSISKTPGLGEFTCCQRSHMIDGNIIPCDRDKIGPVVYDMLEHRCANLLKVNHILVDPDSDGMKILIRIQL